MNLVFEEEYRENNVSSSIFYAKKNSPSKQSLLINLNQDSTESLLLTEPNNQKNVDPKESESNHKSEQVESQTKTRIKKTDTSGEEKKRKPKLKHNLLSYYYPEIPKLEKLPSTKKLPNKRKSQQSPTKLLLKSALKETKKRIEVKSNKKETKKRESSKKKKKHKILKKFKVIKLNEFVSHKKYTVQIEPNRNQNPEPKKPNYIKSNEENTSPINEHPVIDDTHFPFTSLTEWLIWHKNYPELEYVRETHDLDEVPDDSDEIFWVNILNEPEFFNTSWKMAGTIVEDINALKFKGSPNLVPDWDMDQEYTDGFFPFFRDVFQILKYNPNGIQNYRYPILLFALKGLLLLELVTLDPVSNRWFSKGSSEEMNNRLKELDSFVSHQRTHKEYQKIIRSYKANTVTTNWSSGIISFDLLVMKSLFLSTFFETTMKEEDKIKIIKEEDFSIRIFEQLKEIQFLDRQRIGSVLKKLVPSTT